MTVLSSHWLLDNPFKGKHDEPGINSSIEGIIIILRTFIRNVFKTRPQFYGKLNKDFGCYVNIGIITILPLSDIAMI